MLPRSWQHDFAAVFGVSLWSGYALPACAPDTANPDGNRQRFPFLKSGNLSDKLGNFRGTPA
jgi:hypothetical protein